MQVGNNRNFNSPGWGIDDYSGMFSDRQLLAMQTLVDCIPGHLKTASDGSYGQALVAYIGVWIDRFSQTCTSFGRIDVTGEKIQTTVCEAGNSYDF